MPLNVLESGRSKNQVDMEDERKCAAHLFIPTCDQPQQRSRGQSRHFYEANIDN